MAQRGMHVVVLARCTARHIGPRRVVLQPGARTGVPVIAYHNAVTVVGCFASITVA